MDPTLEALLEAARKAQADGVPVEDLDAAIFSRTGGQVKSLADLQFIARPDTVATGPGGAPVPVEGVTAAAPAPPASGFQGAGSGGSFMPDPFKETGDFLNTLRQGMFLPGASDEVGAAVRHPVDSVRHLIPGGSEGPAYVAARDADRESVARYRKAHPKAAIAAEVLGGVSTGKYLPEIPGLKRLPIVLRGGAQGAAFGAAAGAGQAEGGVEKRLEGAAHGILPGAAFGAAADVAVPAVGKVAGRLADLIPGLRPKGGSPSGPGLEFRHTGGGSAPEPGGITPTGERANELLLKNLEADDITLDELRAGANGARGPVSILELGGENVLGAARGARSVQGSKAKARLGDALRERTAGQEERLVRAALDDTGLGQRIDPLAATDEITQKMAREAEQNYGAIRDVEVDDPAVLKQLSRPTWRQAYERAARIRDNQISAAELAGETPPPALPSLDDVVAGRSPVTLGVLDQVKRGLDDVIYSAKREGLGKAEVESLNGARRELLRRLDKIDPRYRDARSAFAGDAALADALESGRDFLRLHPRELQATLDGMGESERLMWRKGALEKLFEHIEATAANRDLTSRRPFNDNTLDEQRLRLLFDTDEGFQKFRQAIKEEARAAVSQRFVTGGSNTVDKLAELANLAGVDLGDILSLAHSPISAAGKIAAKVGTRLVEGHTRSIADALTPKLLAGLDTGNPTALRDLIDELTRTQSRLEAAAAGRRGISRGAGAAGGLFGND